MASLAPACGDTGEGENGTNSAGGNMGCTPGQSAACVCTSGQSGAQVCQPNGSFGPCTCEGQDGGPPPDAGNPKCGNNVVEMGEQCDDGNNVDGDGCSSMCQSDVTCPDDIPQPGECGPEGTCPEDCMKCGNGVENPGECGPMGGCPEDCCLPASTQIYAGMIPTSGPVWQFQGVTGLDAGNAACQAIGADHACTYEEIKEAEKQMELGAVPVGTTMWFHRTLPAVGGAAPGAGCRCNEWKYDTNHISDGEFGVMLANGVIQDNLDPGSCLFDANNPGMYTAPGLDCGGASRAIFCCFAECVKPPTP
jgi:cysteine-rich repeat protein